MEFDEPIVIVEVEPPTALILPSPKLMEAFVDDISKFVASNSNPCESFISKFDPS